MRLKPNKHPLLKLIIPCIVILLTPLQALPQSTMQGTIINKGKKFPISGAIIINLNSLSTTLSNAKGWFKISVAPYEKLLIYFLGYEPIKIVVTNDWIKSQNNEIQLNELVETVDKIFYKQKELTGVLNFDLKKNNDHKIISISGLTYSGYELKGAYGSSYINLSPYSVYGKQILSKADIFEKLIRIADNSQLSNRLNNSFRRVLASALLEMPKKNLNLILEWCGYSNYFVQYGSDLQVLQGVKNCYDELKSLNVQCPLFDSF